MKYDRPKQEIPAQIMGDLLGVIRRQFCADWDDKTWFQNRRFFSRVVTWPAAWLDRRAVTLSPERYKAIFLGILDGVKSHGQTGSIRHWPGYLLRCVQEHWKHHGEAHYEEAKSMRVQAERALLAFERAPRVSGEASQDPVRLLAAAHDLVKPKGRAARRPARCNPPAQLGLEL